MSTEVPTERSFGNSEIVLVTGDITRIPADAIVNAANNAFANGGGVDGAIRREAGPELSGEMRRRYPTGTPTGTAVWTEAYALPARWVIHAVGPVWGHGGQDKLDLLASAYTNALTVAEQARCANAEHARYQRRYLRISDRHRRRCGLADGA